MIASTTRLNTPGPDLAALPGVHALTDVTGFGLAGHALEMARGARRRVEIDWASVPLLPGVRELAARFGDRRLGPQLGRLWAGRAVPEGFAAEDRALLTDPQTSGGLLVACAPQAGRGALRVRAARFRAAPRRRPRRRG